MDAFPTPVPGASLLLAFRPLQEVILIVGGNALAATRAFAALEAEANVIVLAKGGADGICEELRYRADQDQLSLLDLDALPCATAGPSDYWRDAKALDSFIYQHPKRIHLVCITDTVAGPSGYRRSRDSAEYIRNLCRHRAIPVNVADLPDLCDYTFMSTHRFTDPDTGKKTPLQVGLTTNGYGCRLAGRIRRDIVTYLPKEIGVATEKVGKLRQLAQGSEDQGEVTCGEGMSEDGASVTPNEPVAQRVRAETATEQVYRRMKWVAQVSEYWPIRQLAQMKDEDMTSLLDGQNGLRSVAFPSANVSIPGSAVTPVHGLSITPVHCGRILLVGSGPGHPALLTVATHAALTKHAQLVLSDKLVPEAVLALVPAGVEVRIARKFPGNADGAQMELMEAAVQAAKGGLTVVRLKQGDPTVYGRAGEEVLYFRSHGFEPVVIPGVSSVLAGPTFAGIPVTQRGVAESFIVCTGVGRRGKEVKLPGYDRARTLVILMGVARLPQVLNILQCDDAEAKRRDGLAYPSRTPIALIERASMPDQRVVVSTLRDITAALESIGEQRPPGMLVVGWSVLSLWGEGDVTVLDEEAETQDDVRLRTWLGADSWRVMEGLNAGWEDW